MASIDSRNDETGKTIITIRPDVKSFIICLPYVAQFFAISAVVIVSAWRILSQLTHPSRVSSSLGVAFACLFIFGFQGFSLSRWLSSHLGGTSTLVIQGATISIQRDMFWIMSQEGTYPASNLTNLHWEGKRGFLQVGKVVASIGTAPLVLAAGLDDTDGNRVIDLLTDAYPFATPDAAPSPYVIKW